MCTNRLSVGLPVKFAEQVNPVNISLTLRFPGILKLQNFTPVYLRSSHQLDYSNFRLNIIIS